MGKPYYMVICKDQGVYVLATHRHFKTHSAAELYVASIAVTREPLIVLID